MFRLIRVVLALKMAGAFAIVAATLLNPPQPAIAVVRFVGVVLVEAGVHSGFARALA